MHNFQEIQLHFRKKKVLFLVAYENVENKYIWKIKINYM